MFKMIVAISIISVVSEMFFKDGKFKKYIGAVIGIFVLLIIVEGIFSIDPVSIDTSVLDKAEEISGLTLAKAEKELIEIYENNIKEELFKNNIEVLDIYVRCDSDLTITKIRIKLNDINEKNAVLNILTENFGLDISLIEIVER